MVAVTIAFTAGDQIVDLRIGDGHVVDEALTETRETGSEVVDGRRGGTGHVLLDRQAEVMTLRGGEEVVVAMQTLDGAECELIEDQHHLRDLLRLREQRLR